MKKKEKEKKMNEYKKKREKREKIKRVREVVVKRHVATGADDNITFEPSECLES